MVVNCKIALVTFAMNVTASYKKQKYNSESKYTHTKAFQEQKLAGTTNTSCFSCISAVVGGKQRVTFKMARRAVACVLAKSYGGGDTFRLAENSTIFGRGAK